MIVGSRALASLSFALCWYTHFDLCTM